MLSQNNVRISGGIIKSSEGVELCIGSEISNERVKEIYGSKLNILGDVEFLTSSKNPPVLSIIDDTCFINAENLFINGKEGIEFQNDVKINGVLEVDSLTIKGDKVRGDRVQENNSIIEIDVESMAEYSVCLEDDEVETIIFKKEDPTTDRTVVHIQLSQPTVSLTKTFIAKKGFTGKLIFTFESGEIEIGGSVVRIGFSEGGQSVGLVYFDGMWYLKNSGCFIEYVKK
jgi:hypothetical protein